MKKTCSIFLAILLFTNCKKGNPPETIASVQQKIKGKWQVGEETSIASVGRITQTQSVKGNASNSYNFTADSVFISSVFVGKDTAAYTVISPTQIVFKPGFALKNIDTFQVQVLTNSNCILYEQQVVNDTTYQAFKAELKR